MGRTHHTGQVLEETDTSGNMQRDYVFFAGRRIAWRDSSGNAYYYFADAIGSTRAVTNSSGNALFASRMGLRDTCGVYPERSRREEDYLGARPERSRRGQQNARRASRTALPDDYTTSCSPTYKFVLPASRMDLRDTGGVYPERSRGKFDSETGNAFSASRMDLRDYYAGVYPEQSRRARYYNPRLGRFMSADPPRFLHKPGAVRVDRTGPLGGSTSNPQSLNRYSYVQNNPQSFVDPLGLFKQCYDEFGNVVSCHDPPPVGACYGEWEMICLMEGDEYAWDTQWLGPPIFAGNPTSQSAKPKPKPQTQTKPPCTQLQKAAGLIAAQLKSNAESLGLLTLGAGVVSGLLTGGEEVTVGLDTPLTLTAYHATGSFAALGILDLGASAAFESYASGGSPAALENFAWDQFASLAGGFAAEATKIPFVSRFAEPLADLAGRAAALANQAEGGCR